MQPSLAYPPIEDWTAPEFAPVVSALLAERAPIYVVGGAVRDYLLGHTSGIADLDLGLAGPVLPVARSVADLLGWAYYPLDAERDVARIVLVGDDAPNLVCDLAALRGDLATDLGLRDFTVNAMALELAPNSPPRLVDPRGGFNDLAAQQIRAVSNTSLTADPIRALRAVRFAGQLGFVIADETVTQLREVGQEVLATSPERHRDELWKIFSLSHPGDALEQLQQLGLLAHLLPEVAQLDGVAQSAPHRWDVFRHTVGVMEYAAALRDWLAPDQAADSGIELEPALAETLAPWRARLAEHMGEELAQGRTRSNLLIWHGLFHDTGKPSCASQEFDENGRTRIRFLGHQEVSARLAEERATSLHFSRREAQIMGTAAAAHMRPHQLLDAFGDGAISRRAAYRFFRDTATGGRDDQTGLDVLLLALADYQATGIERGEAWRRYLAGVSTLLDFAFAPTTKAMRPLIDGRSLMGALKLSPGPLVGDLLEAIIEAQVAGEVSNEAEALALAATLLHAEGR